MDTTRLRVLFAISDTGGGHRSAALAIKAALEQVAPDRIECHIVDMLTTTGVPLVRNAPDLYEQLRARWLPVFDLAFQLTDGQRRMDTLTWMLYFSAHHRILEVLENTRPHMVVSVHPLANRFIANTRRVYRLSFHFITVVTDLVSLHASWADPQAELCIVPTEEAIGRIDMPADKVVRTGFPVHPKFATYAADKKESRRRLNLPEDRFTVLLTSGGVDSPELRTLVTELDRRYPDEHFLIVTGKNAELKAALEKLVPNPHMHIYGFVNNMEELMGASDIVITKAGPGTLMEALVIGRPVIVTEAIGMQEHGNIDFVLNHELGAFCPSNDRIYPAIAELMKPEVYEATIGRLNNAVPRDGALDIARLLLQRLQIAPPVRSRFGLPALFDLRRLGRHLRMARQRMRIIPRIKGKQLRQRSRRNR